MTEQLPSRRLALAGALATVALAGCSSTKKSSSTSSSEDVNKRLQKAKDKLGSTSAYHVKLTSKLDPEISKNGESGLDHGEGDVVPKQKAFKGDITVQTSGATTAVKVISIGDSTWIKPSISPKYAEFDPSDMGVPKPSALFSTTNGLPAVLTQSKDMKKTGEKLVGGEKVTTYKGTLDGPTTTKAIGFGRARSNYTMEVGLNDKDEVRTLNVTGPFYDSGNATYMLELSNYDAKVSVTKP